MDFDIAQKGSPPIKCTRCDKIKKSHILSTSRAIVWCSRCDDEPDFLEEARRKDDEHKKILSMLIAYMEKYTLDTDKQLVELRKENTRLKKAADQLRDDTIKLQKKAEELES